MSIVVSPSLLPPTFPSPMSNSHFAKFIVSCISDVFAPIVSLMFLVNLKTLHLLHK
ncbi:hypothetical protein HanPSC8_Chr08g0333281 [Helianthus annuus]|nr:hypothetical protein HanPSC8_Chr08g0333281 [Helianthus annuus]